VLVFESRFSLGYCDQFYSTIVFFLGVRQLEPRSVLLVLPSTIPLVTTIWYRMVLDSKYHRIYGIIESMVPAHLCFLDEVLPSINTLHVCACGREEAMRRLHASVRTSPTVCAEHLCLASCYGRLIILLQCVLHFYAHGGSAI